MTAINDGGPAFPDPARGAEQPIRERTPEDEPQGMSLRDWFAGQALAGLSGVDLTDQLGKPAEEIVLLIAKSAYVLADGMLIEKAKGVDR